MGAMAYKGGTAGGGRVGFFDLHALHLHKGIQPHGRGFLPRPFTQCEMLAISLYFYLRYRDQQIDMVGVGAVYSQLTGGDRGC